MKKRPVPRDRMGGIEVRRNNLEKDLSAKQHLQKEDPWIQASHANKGRTAGPEKKTSQGQKAADRLIEKREDQTFPRSIRVRKRAVYRKVQRSGRKTGGRYLILLSMDNDLPASRFGITVSRKTGNAVTRNRIKRRIRELQRLNRSSILSGKDIVVIATRQAAEATFEGMEAEYIDLLRRAGLTKGPRHT